MCIRDRRRSKLGYVSELDGLRGAAILGVMGFHADTPFLKGCFIGVDIFWLYETSRGDPKM